MNETAAVGIAGKTAEHLVDKDTKYMLIYGAVMLFIVLAVLISFMVRYFISDRAGLIADMRKDRERYEMTLITINEKQANQITAQLKMQEQSNQVLQTCATVLAESNILIREYNDLMRKQLYETRHRKGEGE
ncbi:MAG TPA: hypothetical protein VGH19_06640 [Verrucomicrobiae bacterium]